MFSLSVLQILLEKEHFLSISLSPETLNWVHLTLCFQLLEDCFPDLGRDKMWLYQLVLAKVTFLSGFANRNLMGVLLEARKALKLYGQALSGQHVAVSE